MAQRSIFMKNRTAFDVSISKIMCPELFEKEEKPASFVNEKYQLFKEKLLTILMTIKNSFNKLPTNIWDTVDGYSCKSWSVDCNTIEVTPEFTIEDSGLLFSIKESCKTMEIRFKKTM